MIRAIAFDLDHTLYDRNATWGNLVDPFYSRFSDELILASTPDALLEGLRRADFLSTYEETHWKGMHEYLLHDQVVAEQLTFEMFNDFIFDCFPEAIVPYEETYAILNWAREQGYRPSLITNGYPELQERKMRQMELRPYLDEILVCSLYNGLECKPAPEPFLIMAERLGLAPGEIAYVGDNPVNDMQGADRAGMIAIWLDVMHNWPKGWDPPKHRIESLKQLPEMIAAINQNL